MTGLALTAVGVAVLPATDVVARALTSVRPETPDRPSADGERGHRDDGKHHDKAKDKSTGDKDKGKEKKPKGVPVPCKADALIAAINHANARGGAVLDLAPKCTYLLTTNIDGAGLPAITTPITLNGGKHTTIKRAAAADQFRILTVEVGGDLTLHKLTITGGQISDDGSNGGGILVNAGGAATINHSKIIRNIASNGDGGGITNHGITTIVKSTVNRNTAGLSGGGIYTTGLLTIKKSHVEANNASSGGGGIASVGGTVQVGHSTISGNQSNQGAGMFIDDGVIGTILDTRITRNTASVDGGGIFLNFSQLAVRRSILAANTAVSGGGGGLHSEDGSVTVTDSIIKANTASAGTGGGVVNLGDTTLFNTKVTGNTANRGGGLFNDDDDVLTLFNTAVVDNLAIANGGGIFNDEGTVELNTATGTVVAKNSPNNCVDVPGCAG
ncbi:right-handed parallel beta-helix repeat-containing protein [Salinispora arenicola]|uniref:right-handed parallel beta-helix repeat-containing protein n=1 Tax=Salinispora arenicola TaxID=168697 RepID=UPI002079C213|nr:right-handed parallel beta-helix repeat-containing protein [Salinispora arenicola]MCN0155239.1 right-handed parallel beta-helix repeat-containing protein [Salinispora arenicola]